MAGGLGNRTTFGVFKTGSVIAGGLAFRGTWDALNNLPFLQSGIGVAGEYYVVSVAGTTNLDGITDWEVGDWAVFNGVAWQKIDNTDQVTSVNGLQGAVIIGLPSVLGQDNTTGANDISVNSGQTINYNVGLGGSLNSVSTTALRTWNLPDASGTIALLSDIPSTPSLSSVLSVGNTTGANDISVDSGQKITFGGAGKYIEEKSNILDIISDTQIRAETNNSFLRVDNNSFEVTNNTFGGLKSFLVQYGANRVQYRNLVAGFNFDFSLITSNRVQLLQDQNGTIALLSDIPATPTLSAVLTAGNTTGANDIIVGNGAGSVQVISTSNATANERMEIKFTTSLLGVDEISIGRNSLTTTTGFISVTDNGVALTNYGSTFTTSLSLDATGTINLTDSTGSPKIRFQAGGQGDLTSATLTAGRTWTLPDASGTIALTSDIPATPSLFLVLSAGNTTGGNDILMTEGDDVVFQYDTFGNFINTNPLTADRNILLPDADGTIALLSDIPSNAGENIYNTDGVLTNGRLVTTGINTITFANTSDSLIIDPTNNRIGFRNAGFGTATGYITTGGTLTANQTYTLQDASGTLAFLSDIPSTPTLSAVLTAGNSTGANNIIMDVASGTRQIDTNGTEDWKIEFTNTYIAIRQGFGLGGQLFLDNTQVGSRWSNPLNLAEYNNLAINSTGFNFSTSLVSADFELGNNVRLFLQDSGGSLELTRNNTGSNVQAFQDASGTLAFLSDIPSTPSLSSVLAVGNTTGANNILVNNGQDIRSNTSGNTLNLDDSSAGVGNSAFSITQDNGTYGSETGWLYGETNNGIQLGYQLLNSPLEAIGIGVYASGITPLIYTAKEVVITDNRTANANSGNIDKRATFIATNGGVIQSGVVNTAIVGGTDITASVNNALYTNQLRLQSSANNFDGILDIPTLTADRTYTLQDSSGTLAFLSDIPAGLGNIYTNDGVLTGNRLVTQNGFDLVYLDSNGGIIRFDDSNAQLTIEGTIIGTTPKFVVKGESSLGTIRVNDQYASQILTYDQVGTGGKLNLLQASSSLTQTQTFQDASGTIALTSDFQTGEAYSVTGLTTDRSFNANTTSVNELADIVGTLISDLQSVNILL